MYGRSFGLATGAAGWLPKPSGAKFSNGDARRLELCSVYGCALARTRLLVPSEVMFDGKPNDSEERVRFHLLQAGYPPFIDNPVEWMTKNCDDPMLSMDMVEAIIGFHGEPVPRAVRGAAEPDSREGLVAKHGEAWFGLPQANASEMQLLTPWGPADLAQEREVIEEISKKSVSELTEEDISKLGAARKKIAQGSITRKWFELQEALSDPEADQMFFDAKKKAVAGSQSAGAKTRREAANPSAGSPERNRRACGYNGTAVIRQSGEDGAGS